MFKTSVDVAGDAVITITRIAAKSRNQRDGRFFNFGANHG